MNFQNSRHFNLMVAGLGMLGVAGIIAVHFFISGGFGFWPVCFMKLTTGLPCPTCGTTRSAMAFLSGNFLSAIYLNPLGFILTFALLVLPIWALIDLIGKRKSLMRVVSNLSNHWLNSRIFLFFMVVLLLINWIWNIQKGV